MRTAHCLISDEGFRLSDVLLLDVEVFEVRAVNLRYSIYPHTCRKLEGKLANDCSSDAQVALPVEDVAHLNFAEN